MEKQVHTSHEESKYFIMGNNKIIVKEHFKENGKTINSILEKMILDAGKVPENRINT